MRSFAVRGGAAARRLLGAAAAVLLPSLAAPAAAQEEQVPQAEAPAQRAVVVDSVVVRGAERVPVADVERLVGILPGEAIDYRDIQQALRRLWSLGEFRDAQVSAQPAPAGADGRSHIVLVVEVDEQPLLASVDFRGLEHASGSTIRDTVGLERGEALNPSRIAAAETMIRQMLTQEGFAPSIEHRLEPVDGENAVRLVFDVEEGRRVAIADVQFDGNEVFSDDRLEEVMATREEGFLWFRPGTFDPEVLREDLRQRLPTFYGSNGYLDFAVTGDSLVVDPRTGKARLVVSVQEGPQYVLADFDIRGNRRYSTEELSRFFNPDRSGLLQSLGLASSAQRVGGRPVFDAPAFSSATGDITQLYRNSGYLYANVQEELNRIEIDGQPAVEVAWVIQEGEPAYVNRIEIEGNTVTHEQVIRDRIVLLPGDVYSDERLIQSYRSISSLGFFQAPMPFPRMEPTEDGDVNITFEVQEKSTGSLNFGTAIGGGTVGIAGFLGYEQPNLFGKAKAGYLRWEFGQYSNNFEARYSDPAILDSRWSGSLSLFSSRDRFYRSSEGERRRTGVGARIGYPFPLDPRWTRFYVGYSISETSYDEDDSSQGTIYSLDDALQSTVSTGLVRSTLDHPLFPTIGSRQSLDMEFNGGPLGGDGDFQKYSASGSWFVPVGQLGGETPGSRPIRFTLGLSAETGALFGDASRFPFERYLMGGVQFGEPLRGYEETTVTPDGYLARGRGTTLDRFGNAYLRMSAEYAMRFNDNLSVSAFYDAGNVWDDLDEIDPTRLFRGAGIGVLLVTPFGPVGLDYAYGFDKEIPGWQLHFKFGQMF